MMNEAVQMDEATLNQHTQTVIDVVAKVGHGDSPIVLNLEGVATFTRRFIILSGADEDEASRIAFLVESTMKEQNVDLFRKEGLNTDWCLLDFGDFIVHCFTKASRQFYNLEKLWRDAPRLEQFAVPA
jgi:ribosome-associated protein